MLDFKELEEVLCHLSELDEYHPNTLNKYYNEVTSGFFHKLEDIEDPERWTHISIGSTVTCVSSLLAAGHWRDDTYKWHDKSEKLISNLLRETWTSAELDEKNPFTTAWVLEGVINLLENQNKKRIKKSVINKVNEAQGILLTNLSKGNVVIERYPPSAYLTQLAVRSLKNSYQFKIFNKEEEFNQIKDKIREWSQSEIYKQITLKIPKHKNYDPYQLGFSIIIFSNLSDPKKTNPDDGDLISLGLEHFFSSQESDGSWPRSRPIFHYPSIGHALCYEYEFLVQLLHEESLEKNLHVYSKNLINASNRLYETSYQLGKKTMAWASGHHPQLGGPESWSTASAYHFLYEFGRYISDAVKRIVFNYINPLFPYHHPSNNENVSTFAPGFLDCPLKLNGRGSLRKILMDSFLNKVKKELPELRKGRPLDCDTPCTMIFYGPPGTSKTRLGKEISQYIGWPLLTIDPSHFVRHGLDSVLKEAEYIFRMLVSLEQTVVLLDEIDELVRARDQANEAFSRFLTTAMLPKLSQICDQRKIIFIVATNHIDNFDIAIKRPGRFDLIIPVLPPSVNEKLRDVDDFRNMVTAFKIIKNKNDNESAKRILQHLTFAETKSLDNELKNKSDVKQIMNLFEKHEKKCTLNTLIPSENQTWHQKFKNQEDYMRTE